MSNKHSVRDHLSSEQLQNMLWLNVTWQCHGDFWLFASELEVLKRIVRVNSWHTDGPPHTGGRHCWSTLWVVFLTLTSDNPEDRHASDLWGMAAKTSTVRLRFWRQCHVTNRQTTRNSYFFINCLFIVYFFIIDYFFIIFYYNTRPCTDKEATPDQLFANSEFCRLSQKQCSVTSPSAASPGGRLILWYMGELDGL